MEETLNFSKKPQVKTRKSEVFYLAVRHKNVISVAQIWVSFSQQFSPPEQEEIVDVKPSLVDVETGKTGKSYRDE